MIKFLDLQRVNAIYQKEIKQLFSEVLNSGQYLSGNSTSDFESGYADYCGTNYCIGVGNGLDALSLIIRAYKELGMMKEGDEIIAPANTYIASLLSISENRLNPVLVEPDIKTFNIDPDKIEEKISSKTRAILIVHLYGRVAMDNKIKEVAEKYNLKIIEDCAQAHGVEYNGCRAGNLGHAGGHSFYPTKNLGALGDAGAVTTNDPEVAKIVRTIANYGSDKKYNNRYKGRNSRMDALQAAVLSMKLKYLDKENQIRESIALKYLHSIDHPGILLPLSEKGSEMRNVWHLFVIRTMHRDELKKYLFDRGIGTEIHYPIPPHKQLAYSEWKNFSYPITEKIHKEVLSIPLNPRLAENEILQIIECLNAF